MKKTIVSLVCTVLVCMGITKSFAIDCKDLPQKTSPAKAVNDFAHIVDPGKAAELERQLQEYWNTTSIAVVVITVDSMNGNDQFDYSLGLFNCWTIGDKTNRGVLIFIAKNEHKISIRTGKGIEFLMTDAESGEIIHNDMEPLFHDRKYSDGVDVGVQKVIAKLQTMSWDDRMAGIAQKKQIEEKEHREMMETVTNVFWVILSLALIVVLLVLGRRSAFKSAKKNTVRDLNKKIRIEIAAGRELLAKSIQAYKNAPTWAQKENQDHNDIAMNALRAAEGLLDYSEQHVGSDTAEALVKSNQAEDKVSSAFESFKKIDQGLWQKIKSFAADAPAKLDAAYDALESALKVVADNKSFKFENYHTELDNLVQLIEKYRLSLSDVNQLKDVCENADLIAQKANKISATMTETVQTKLSIDTGITQLKEGSSMLLGKMDEVNKTLVDIKKKYPQSVWQSLEANFSKLTPVLDVAVMSAVLLEITRLNNFSVQDFAHANAQYISLQGNLTSIESLFSDITSVTKNQEAAKAKYTAEHDSVAQVIATSISTTKDSDVGTTARDLAKKASGSLKEVELEVASGHLIDWIVIYQLLSGCKTTASSAISKAKSDISDAENERQRKARQAREDSERATAASFSAYSVSSFNSGGGGGGSLSDGGFGGFSGGTTGGGGGDGGWS